MPEWHARDEAWQRARSFARRFGEPHVRLAMHGAVPIGLTPELLHLIRVNFVAATPWVAEADLLLSPLCRDVGGGLFEMDEELRGLLVEELQRDTDFGPARLLAVADFLGAWADRVREAASDPEWSDFVEGQALTALSYRKPEEAAEALARSLNTAQGGRGSIDARVIKLTQGLSTALMSQVEVVTYAVALDKLAAGDVDAALEHFGALGPMDQPVKIGNVQLPAPSEWAITAQGAGEVAVASEGVAEAKGGTTKVELIGKSEAIRKVREIIRRIAHTEVPVLIRGETGTGKDLAARAIHEAGSRAGKFVAVSCGALPEELLSEELFGRRGEITMTGRRAGKGGAFEGAKGGTLFLDEIAEMPQALQARLLSVLQDHEFTQSDGARAPLDARILAATNRDLQAESREGIMRFSEALHYRLSTIELIIPPLRDRGEDIIILAEHFISKITRRSQLPTSQIPAEVRHSLLNYHWPGNVRELENVMERLAILGSGGEISLKDLPPEIQKASSARGRVLMAYTSNVGPDRNVSARIAESLSSAGYSVFQAPQNLVDDRGVTRMILSRLRESQAMIVVYSATSRRGKWLSRLVDFAHTENVSLFPVIVAGTSGEENPAPLLGIEHLKHLLWNDSDPESSLRSLRSALDRSRQPPASQPDLPKIYVSCVPEDRQLGLRICEYLEERGRSVSLDEPHGPPPGQWGESLQSLLNQGSLLILILSGYDARNIWLQQLSGLTMPSRNQILPIRPSKLSDSQPPNWLRRFPWFDEGARTVPEILARIDRFIAASSPPSGEAADDIYMETETARNARQAVLSGSSVIVSGARRSGKTSLLRYLQGALEERDVAAQYVRSDQKYDLATNAVLLIDDVRDLKETYGHLSRSQRKTQTVLATRAASGYGRMHVIELPDFTLDQTNELNRRFGSPLRPRQIEELFDLLDGHPDLTSAAITAAAQRRLDNVADVSKLQPIEEELHLLDHELGAGDLRRAWAGLLSGARLDMQAQDRLLALGLAKKRDGSLVPRNRLYREFFAERRSHTDDSLRTYEKAIEIAEERVRQKPGRTDYLHELWASYRRMGDLMRDQGRSEEARMPYLKALEIAERLVRQEPESAECLRALSVSCNELGDLVRDQGDIEQAREFFSRALAIAEQLGDQRTLLACYNNMGELMSRLGELEQAREFFYRALAIAEQLGDQRTLLICHNNVGKVLDGQGEAYRAHQFYEKAVEIAERLVRDEPDRADHRRDLAISLSNEGSRRSLERALEILRRLKHGGMQLAQDDDLIRHVEKLLANFDEAE